MPDDFVPKPLGGRREIIERIRSAVPIAEFSDPAWGRIDGPDFSIEVSLGADELVESFAFHVRGGDAAVFVVADILEHLGFRAFDGGSESGLFEVGPDGSDAQKKWRAYRDQILKGR